MMRKIGVFIVLALMAGSASAENFVVKLWLGGAPGAIVNPAYREFPGEDKPQCIHQVSDPSLTVYLPPVEKRNGTAVIICPGGGYRRVCMGSDVAEWLNSLGVAGIVLKYRLPSEKIMEDKTIGPLQDVQEAIRIVRRRSEEWGINPNKVGILGTSAGGHLAATASTLFHYQVYKPGDAVSARPDFAIMGYPIIKAVPDGRLLSSNPDPSRIQLFSAHLQVTPETLPAFLFHAADDPVVPVNHSILYFEAMRKNGVPCELHIFDAGGHGFEMGQDGGTKSTWPEMVRLWMGKHGWL